MPSLLDARPPGLNLYYRSGNPVTVTLNWPADALTGRTFTAALDGASLTVDVVDDAMTITVSAAQTTAAEVTGAFVLTETTGGASNAVIIGTWYKSNEPYAVSSATVEVTESSGTVTVEAVGIPSNAVLLTTDQSVAGTKTFASSPLVPNPASSNTNAAASIGEVEDLIAAEPLLIGAETVHLAALPAISVLFPIENTTTESTVLSAGAYEVGGWVLRSTIRFDIIGTLRNQSGAPVTFTLRVRNTTDSILFSEVVVTLASEAAQREFRWTIDGVGNESLSDGLFFVSKLEVAPGTSDPAQSDWHRANPSLANISNPHNINVTVQMSVADADAEVRCYGINLMYSHPT